MPPSANQLHPTPTPTHNPPNHPSSTLKFTPAHFNLLYLLVCIYINPDIIRTQFYRYKAYDYHGYIQNAPL